MKVLPDSVRLNVHTQEFYPNKLQPHKIKSKPVSGAKGLILFVSSFKIK